MDAFKHIAANPAFNRNMTEVIYDGRLFQQHFLEPEMYYRAYKLAVRNQGEGGERVILADCERAEKEIRRDMKDIKRAGSTPSERELAALKALRERTYRGRVLKSMKQYVQLYLQQEEILDTGRDKDVLSAGLKQMPNVYRLLIIDQFAKADHAPGVEQLWPARYRNAVRIISDEDIEPVNRSWDCRGIINVLEAAATHNPNIDSFELGLGSSNAPIGVFDSFFNDTTLIHTLARGLNRLALHLDSAWTSADFNRTSTPEEVSCLKTMLQQAKGLFSLVADISLTSRQWNYVFSGLYFPHLITLHLDRLAYMRPNVLIGLLERHRASLRELKICEADLLAEDGTWKDVARRIGQSLNLRYIGLGNMVDVLETGRFQYSYDGYYLLAMLFIPSYSPQNHYLHEGLNLIEVMRRKFERDPWYIALEAKAKRLA